MLNQPTSPLIDDDSQCDCDWNMDRNPQFRFVLLWVGMAVPLFAILARAAQLQLQLQDDFAAVFATTTETFESIPARDGRIMSADGVVLAMDVHTYNIAVKYPMIEQTPGERWIVEKAKERLSPKEARDKKKLAAAKERILEYNKRFWLDLASLTNRSEDELIEARHNVQVRVETIKESVRKYRERRAQESHKSDSNSQSSTWSRVGNWLGIRTNRERSEIADLLQEEREYHTIVQDVSAVVKAEIDAHPNRYPYTRVIVQSRRTYPQGELAAHMIGHRKPLTEEEFKERQNLYPDGDPQEYCVGDPCGLSGLERQYDAVLKGIRGKRVMIKNHRDQIVDSREIKEPQHGKDLVLHLDFAIQQEAERILVQALKVVTKPGSADLESSSDTHREPTCPQGGAVVAMDVHTGAIIAAASAPSFDLNQLVTADRESWDDLIADRRMPMFSRVTKMKLPPGSVFKVISAVAAIESGKIAPESKFDCRGYLDNEKSHRCFTFLHQGLGHGDVTLTDALCRSCNVYFYAAARRMGPQTLVHWAREFGIGRSTGIDLPWEEAGYLPAPDTQHKSWKPGQTLGLAIGQDELQVTPLQMVCVMAAVANDGQIVTPRLAANTGAASVATSDSVSNSLARTESRPIRGLHSQTLDVIREGLAMVVRDPHGTGYKTVRMKEISIAGKTGTAQNHGVDHAWFAGYVPAEQPRIAFVVVLEHGGSGGKAAGPVAHDFVRSLVDLERVSKPTRLASDQRRTSR